MGNFYTNFTVRNVDQIRVGDALSGMGRDAYVAPLADGDTVFYDRESDEQNVEIIQDVGKNLSRALDTASLAVLNHDDDILCYWLFMGGELVDDYDSCPSYFEAETNLSPPSGGDASKLCEAFGCPENTGQVEEVLQKPSFDEGGFAFAVLRHFAIVNAVRLPTYAVATGFGSIELGELPEGLELTDLIHTSK